MIVSEPVIRMENIIKRYYIGKPNELQILNGISLSVDQGEFVSIVGESGSGKSTLSVSWTVRLRELTFWREKM